MEASINWHNNCFQHQTVLIYHILIYLKSSLYLICTLQSNSDTDLFHFCFAMRLILNISIFGQHNIHGCNEQLAFILFRLPYTSFAICLHVRNVCRFQLDSMRSESKYQTESFYMLIQSISSLTLRYNELIICYLLLPVNFLVNSCLAFTMNL